MAAIDINGKTVVLAGTPKGWKQADIKSKLEQLGARVTGSISSKTELVFVSGSGGKKAEKAKELGIALYEEAELLTLLIGEQEERVPAPPEEVPSTKPAEVSEESAESTESASPLADKVIVLTGTFVTMKRAEAAKLVQQAGATVGSSVTKKTDLLVYGDKAGSKLSKAHKLGIETITEAEFIEQLMASLRAGGGTEAEAEEEPVAVVESMFSGKVVVLTGTFVTMKRSEAQNILKQAGATIGSGVTKKTDYLIYGDKAGSKLSKAQSLGTSLMTEAELVDMLNQVSVGSDALAGAAEKIAKANAEEARRMKKVNKLIDAVNEEQRKRWGATLPELLLLYFKLFSQRPDVHVYTYNIGRPTPNNTLRNLEKHVPPELLALHQVFGAVEFNWCFEEHKSERHNYSEGYNGGRLNLVGLERFRWYSIPDWRKEYDDYEYEAMFDDFVAEGTAVFSLDKGDKRTEATLIFDNANDCERHYLGKMESYLTEGAQSGFVWYWQMGGGGADNFLGDLQESSFPRGTAPIQIEAALIEKGASKQEAQALMAWLKEHVVLLLHQSDFEADRSLVELEKVFPYCASPSSRGIDSGMVGQLLESTEPMPESEWETTLREHKRFLDEGGGGGVWRSLSVEGLPLCIYSGATASAGEQAVFRLKKVQGIDAHNAHLAYADLSSMAAERTDFSGADLSHSMLIDSRLDGCSFAGADLRKADLSGASLVGANFRDADLRGADFEATDLTGADFTGANLKDAVFLGATLKNVTYSK